MQTRRLWVFGCWVAGLGLLGCSDGTTADGTPLISTGGASSSTTGEAGASGLPPSGFYMETLTTKSDDCSPTLANGERPNRSVFAKENGFNVGLGWNGARQDVPWQGSSEHLTSCDMTLNVDVTSFDATSIDLDVTELWNSIDGCGLPSQEVPQAPCSREWLQHLELEIACPASIQTASGTVSCP